MAPCVGYGVPAHTGAGPVTTSDDAMLPSPFASAKLCMGYAQYPPIGYPTVARCHSERMVDGASPKLSNRFWFPQSDSVTSQPAAGPVSTLPVIVASIPRLRIVPLLEKMPTPGEIDTSNT